MEGDASFNKVEVVYVSHVEDAVTFWGQASSDILKKALSTSKNRECAFCKKKLPSAHTEASCQLCVAKISMNRIHDISHISESLAKFCPTMSTVFGTPDLDKVYGGMFSADKCWYRCKVLHVVNDEQCAVSYIDYGNSEVLDRSSIVELPEELQSTPIAQKYRLWGLQLLTASDIEQGLKFLTQLVGDQQISVQQKAIYKDGTVVVQVSHNDLDIGEEVAKQGFALRSKLISSPNGALETMDAPANEIRSPYSWQIKSIERLPMREPKSLPMFNQCSSGSNKEHFAKSSFQAPRSQSTDTNTVKSDQKCLEENAQLKEENRQLKGECMQIKEANKQIKDESMQLDEEHKLLKSENKKLLDDYRQLKEEKEILFQKSIALEQHVQKMQFQNKNERESFERNINEMEMRLASAAGHKLKALMAKIDILKNVRRENINMTAADDLLEAVKVVGQEQLCAPSTLNILEENWKEYSCAQETIRECSDLVELDLLIEGRNKAKEQLNVSVDAFVIEVDQLPLESRLAKLQVLLNSLEDMYGASCSCEDSDVVFQEFYNWKEAKLEKFSTVRSDTDSSLGLMCTWLSDIEKYFDLKSDITFGSSDDVFDIDNLLQKVDCNVSKELEISLVKPSESDCKIIRNAYGRVVKLIYEETCLISVVKAKYLASIEFQKNISEWINKKMNVDDLINIKKSIKILKAELRWKLHVSSSMEESEEYDAAAHSEVKAEIATIRNKIFCEIQREREEYALLSDLTQKWFPELPLMYSNVGITSYMNSGGLLSGSMERMLFDAEPLKELSNKRPLVCTKVQNQKVLLKGYSVGMDTEEQVIVRASKYHKAWLQQKEESGILQLLYLFFCKFDPVVYVMVPFYPGESLGCIQANNKLTSYETMRVMRGVAHGLHTLHASNIIIGSLHENNVFAVNRERGIVGDFDFTRDEEQRSSATSICFPMLTAPEVKLGQPASASSDVYVYGILLLWLCTGSKSIIHKPDGTPDLKKFDLDSKAESLLSRLVCCGDRMQAEQIKTHEYFQFTEAA